MFMVFQMEGIRDYQGLSDLVGKFVEGNTGVSDFYICLNPDEKYELDDSRKSPYEDEMEMLLHAYYGKKMSIEVPMPQTLFKRKNLLFSCDTFCICSRSWICRNKNGRKHLENSRIIAEIMHTRCNKNWI